MKKILIIGNQKWIIDLFHNELLRERYTVSVAPDAEIIQEHIMSGKFDLVLLSLYLQHGSYVWEVLQHIKKIDPDLPVIILAEYDKYLYEPQLELAEGYVVKSSLAVKELKRKMNAILCDE
ncbi:MAG: response regulator [Desulfobacterales bacterium]|jgi:DNA-binding NtrC family response regulator